MTAVVGVFCTDGAVIGTDSSATFGPDPQFRTIEQETDKIYVIENSIIVAATGEIGSTQRLCSIIRQAWTAKVFAQKEPLEVGKIISGSLVKDWANTGIPLGKWPFGALIAFPHRDRAQLCEFYPHNFQPELKDERIWYCSMGSGQSITDPFLGLMREIFWEKGPPRVRDAIFAVTWALDHVIRFNPGGVNKPARVAVLGGNKGPMAARVLDDTELAQHRQLIEEAKKNLGKIPENLKPEAATQEVPKP